MEALYKAKWQGHFDGGQKRHFSRIMIIMSSFSAKMAAGNCSGNAILAEYDELFQKKFKKSIGAFLEQLKQERLVKTLKSRGCHVEASV